jgi:hypothetical protein
MDLIVLCNSSFRLAAWFYLVMEPRRCFDCNIHKFYYHHSNVTYTHAARQATLLQPFLSKDSVNNIHCLVMVVVCNRGRCFPCGLCLRSFKWEVLSRQSSAGLRPKSDCSGKAQKQLYSNLQTCPLVREGATKLQTFNCLKEISWRKKNWSQVPLLTSTWLISVGLCNNFTVCSVILINT